MSKRGITITIVIAVVLLAVAAFLLTRNTNPPVDTTQLDTTNPTTQETAAPNSTDQSAVNDVTIVYTNNGFAKPTLTVGAGDTIRVQNDSDSVLDFASDDHPTHQKQSALNLGEAAPGESKTFVMDATGTWGYHNHDNPAHTGTLIVQ